MSKAKINLKIDAEENRKNDNICPKCKKGALVVTISRAGFAGKKTVFKSFCPVCGYTIKEII